MRSAVLVRAVVSLAVGVVVGLAAGIVLGTVAGVLAGWAAAALTSVVWVLLLTWRMDAAQTRAHATAEDPGRRTARIIAVLGSVASLGAVAAVLVQTRSADAVGAMVLGGIAVVAVAASWALIQVDYMLRYAHLYYADPVGGIDFTPGEDPSYSDFVYFAVGIGMTYQVSDNDVRANGMRRVVVAQSLLAYLFGAVILATVINLVTSLG
ncbi:DUF1345 domain-containing protein [Microbacterium sp.]|uniref:DUF1345 domain-containing protein n=1 Tax=Microbacterium sp. TaxID=51671 RepID=UPI0032219412